MSARATCFLLLASLSTLLLPAHHALAAGPVLASVRIAAAPSTSPGTSGAPADPLPAAPPASASAPAQVPAAAPAAPIVPSTPADLPAFDLSRPEIRSFVAEAQAQGIPPERVIAALRSAEPQPQIVDAMNRPAEKTLQWWEYRAHMLTPARIAAGAQLWREHKELLDQVAIEYGVPPEYIVAVLGIETLYGRITGHYRVIDALATLAFDYPPRADYFRHELTDFLLLAHEEHLNLFSVRGSYAGAMGALQFMPSSYRKFAISERRGRHSDLWQDWGDIFASTANFLHQAGWQSGQPVLAETHFSTDPNLTPGDHLQLSETLGTLRSRGLSIASDLPDATPALLLAAPEPDGMRYRVGFRNFFVITRYNSSPAYAMAVYDLAKAIRERVALDAAL
ncbi:MAG TPA: lytic murein transglycosylase B [Steroidobacteraceae bacterium]|nr:lytic murein transglycosylase B [Steroidobacteraceae bacterium]